MSETEILLQAIVTMDGQAVRDLLAALPFERQLRLARKVQSLNLAARKAENCTETSRVYAHFDLLGNTPELQERLTIRVVAGESRFDVYTVQRNLRSGRMMLRFKAHSEAQLSLSRVEIQAPLVVSAGAPLTTSAIAI